MKILKGKNRKKKIWVKRTYEEKPEVKFFRTTLEQYFENDNCFDEMRTLFENIAVAGLMVTPGIMERCPGTSEARHGSECRKCSVYYSIYEQYGLSMSKKEREPITHKALVFAPISNSNEVRLTDEEQNQVNENLIRVKKMEEDDNKREEKVIKKEVNDSIKVKATPPSRTNILEELMNGNTFERVWEATSGTYDFFLGTFTFVGLLATFLPACLLMNPIVAIVGCTTTLIGTGAALAYRKFLTNAGQIKPWMYYLYYYKTIARNAKDKVVATGDGIVDGVSKGIEAFKKETGDKIDSIGKSVNEMKQKVTDKVDSVEFTDAFWKKLGGVSIFVVVTLAYGTYQYFQSKQAKKKK